MSEKRLSQPLYEGLPWIYVVGGAIALFGSYALPYPVYPILSVIVGVLGFVGVLGGTVVLLRRRDYRRMRSEYGNADSSLNDQHKD